MSYDATEVDALDWFGDTALTTAALWGYNEIIKMLVNAGADLEHYGYNGYTALKAAAAWGYDDTVQVGSILPSLHIIQTGPLSLVQECRGSSLIGRELPQ